MKRMQAGWVGGLVCLVSLGVLTSAWGASFNTERTQPSGYWDDTNWSDGEPDPPNGDWSRAFVGSTITNWGADNTLDALQPTATCAVSNNNGTATLWVGSGQDGPATGTLNVALSGTLSCEWTLGVGYSLSGGEGSQGTINHFGSGLFEVPGGDASFGYGSAANRGIYNLSNENAQLTVSVADLKVGRDGYGEFNHYKGTVAAGQHIIIGEANGSVGEYTLHDGTITVAGKLYVGDAGTGTFTQVGGTCTLPSDGLYVGDDAGSVGTCTFGGTFSCNDGFRVGESGRGTVNILSGASLSVQYGLYVARLAGSEGTVQQSGGTITVNSGGCVGCKGSATYNQSGGLLDLNTTFNVGGDDATASAAVGDYNLSGGTCDVSRAVSISAAGQGTVNQTGGRLKALTGQAWNYFNIGTDGGEGVYNLSGGTLEIVRYKNAARMRVYVGSTDSDGTLNMGDAAGTGALIEKDGAVPGGGSIDLIVRRNEGASGTFRGWSDDGVNKFDLRGVLSNSGRVIADGYGTDRSLNLSTMSSVTNSWGVSDNTSSNGWFAQDHGKLILPGITVAQGNTYNWGEASDDATIDMVNSARITFTDLSAGSTLTGALLSPDRGDVPAGPVSLISAHDFSLSGGAISTNFDITIRYDDAAAGTEESELRLFHYTGGKWVDTAASLDPGNNRITATNLTSFSPFGVGFESAVGTMFKIR